MAEQEIPTLNGVELTNIDAVKEALSVTGMLRQGTLVIPGSRVVSIHNLLGNFEHKEMLEQLHESESDVVILGREIEELSEKETRGTTLVQKDE